MATRMSTRLILAAAALGIGLATAGRAQEANRIAFVDMNQVFTDYYKTKRADARLKEQAETYNQERRAKVDRLKELDASFNAAKQEAQDDTLSAEARERRRAEAEDLLLQLRELEGEIRTFDETGRKQLEDQGKRMRARIVDEIREVINAHARARGLFAVVDSSGPSLNQVPVFMYIDSAADVTPEILAKLNEGQAEDTDDPLAEILEEDAAEAAAPAAGGQVP
jgi:outer membrane protein